MAKDCGRIVGKRGAVLQKKFDDDKRRDRPWETSLWACFEPVDLCLLTTFCPCITCGKTYHRFHNDGDMRDWEVVNIPCAAMGTAIFYSVGCVIPPFMAWQTGRVRALGNIEGHRCIDWLKSWICTCCVVIQNEKESKLLYERRGVHGGDGSTDQQYTGSAGAGQEMVMPGPVEIGAVMHEEGITGQIESGPANAEYAAELTASPEEELGVERRDHTPSYLDGSFDGTDDQVVAPVPKDQSNDTIPTGTSPSAVPGPGSYSPKSRAARAPQTDPPVSLTEPRSVARSHNGWLLRIQYSSDSLLEREWFAQKLGSSCIDSPNEPAKSPTQDQPMTETSPQPQQTEGSTNQTAELEPLTREQDAIAFVPIEQHSDRPAERTAYEYSHTQNTADPTEASFLGTGSPETTSIHEPPRNDQESSPAPHQPIDPATQDNDTPTSTKIPHHTITSAERVAVLESLVQGILTLDQGSLDRLHLRSEWRWLRGDVGQA